MRAHALRALSPGYDAPRENPGFRRDHVGCKDWLSCRLTAESLETNTDRWLTIYGARLPTQKSAAWIAASYQSNDEQYQDRPNSSGDDLIDDPGPNMDSQVRE